MMLGVVDCILTVTTVIALYHRYYFLPIPFIVYLLPHYILTILTHVRSTTPKHIGLNNQVILLTGASGGIGLPLTRRLINHSPKGLILWDNDENSLQSLFTTISTESPYCQCIFYTKDLMKSKESIPVTSSSSSSPICIFIVIDITDQQCFQKTQNIISSHFPLQSPTTTAPKPTPTTSPITCLINNAGLIRPITLPSHCDPPNGPNMNPDSDSTEKLIYAVNCHAPTNLTRELIHAHTSTNSNHQLYIQTVASAAAMSYSTQLSAYCGSKAALVQALRAMRLEHLRIVFDKTTPFHHSPERSQNKQSFTRTPASFQPVAIFKALISMICMVWLQGLSGLSQNRTNSTRSPQHIHWMTYMPWHIDTLMFNNVYSYPFINLFVPSLSKHFVADQIVDDLLGRISLTATIGNCSSWSERVLPWILTITPLFELLPLWLSDSLVGIAGGWNAMDTWADPRVGNVPSDITSTE